MWAYQVLRQNPTGSSQRWFKGNPFPATTGTTYLHFEGISQPATFDASGGSPPCQQLVQEAPVRVLRRWFHFLRESKPGSQGNVFLAHSMIGLCISMIFWNSSTRPSNFNQFYPFWGSIINKFRSFQQPIRAFDVFSDIGLGIVPSQRWRQHNISRTWNKATMADDSNIIPVMSRREVTFCFAQKI